MAVIRLIGQHIAYSASPAMHRAAFAQLGLDHRYELADVAPAELPEAIAALRDDDCLGANVTVPHKAAVMALLDELDDGAHRAGAVNTIVNRGGRLHGSNTDVPAIAEQAAALRPAAARALVLGAGGAARAVRLALLDGGAGTVTLVARGGTGAAGAAHPEGVAAWSDLPALVAGADLLVNATPVGTESDESPLPAALHRRALAVLDLVYRPSPSRLVREARANGAQARGGAGVLLGQGWRSLAAWLGMALQPPVIGAMAAALRAELGAGADA